MKQEIKSSTDGAGMVVWVETHISQGACAYPITSSTTMGSGFQRMVANGKKNLWDEDLVFIELESEHSSASTCEGFALSGGRITNFTSGQGLILMKEVLYTISGKRLPVVFHIGSRTLTSQSLNVHAGHDDVMGVSDCGWGMLFARNAQEAGDLALIARRTAEKSFTPFMNIMDGFLTTHTTENVSLPDPEMMKDFIGSAQDNLVNLMDPFHPVMSGVVQNQDAFMKGKISQRYYTEKVIKELRDSMREYERLTGRQYDLVRNYKMEDAEWALVGMGSMMETSEATADYLRDASGQKVGVVHVTSFRPFPGKEMVKALKNVKGFTVMERVDNPLAESNPLTLEIKAAFADFSTNIIDGKMTIPKHYSCSAGLGSRDVRPADIISIVDNMVNGGRPYFAVGIDHELAITPKSNPDIRPPYTFSMRGHSVGGYGSVTTNKIIASVVEDLFKLNVQAYPKYGSEKKGLPTTYFLTVSREKVRTHNELEFVEFVPINDINAFNIGDPLKGLTDGGAIFIQTMETEHQKIWNHIPSRARREIVKRHIHVYVLDTMSIAREISSREDLRQRMQGIILLGIFLKVTPFAQDAGIDHKTLLISVKKLLNKYFGKFGEQVVNDNYEAVKKGYDDVFEIPREIIEENKELEKA